MKLSAVLFMTLFAAAGAAQTTTPGATAPVTKEHVLGRMDANARNFKSVDTAIERRQWDSLTEKSSTDSGRIYMQATKSSPRIKLEITEPQKRATAALIDDGKFEVYESATNTLQQGKVKSSEVLQLLLIGFGVTSQTILKSFKVDSVTQETLNKEVVTLIKFQSIDPKAQIIGVRLWLSPKDWTPVQTELMKLDKDTWTFTYKDKKLNTNISSSAFKLSYPRDVIKR